MCRKTTSGENPTERLAFGGCLQTLALCTVSNFADTLRRFAVYPRFALCRAALLNPLFEYIRTDDRCAYTSECEYKRTRSAFGGCLQTLALCTVSNFADTLRRFAVYPRFALCRAALLNPTTKNTHRIWCVFFCAEIKSRARTRPKYYRLR